MKADGWAEPESRLIGFEVVGTRAKGNNCLRDGTRALQLVVFVFRPRQAKTITSKNWTVKYSTGKLPELLAEDNMEVYLESNNLKIIYYLFRICFSFIFPARASSHSSQIK